MGAGTRLHLFVHNKTKTVNCLKLQNKKNQAQISVLQQKCVNFTAKSANFTEKRVNLTGKSVEK